MGISIKNNICIIKVREDNKNVMNAIVVKNEISLISQKNNKIIIYLKGDNLSDFTINAFDEPTATSFFKDLIEWLAE